MVSTQIKRVLSAVTIGLVLAPSTATVQQAFAQSAPVAQAAVSQEEATDIAREAYIYAYPLVLMEMTRRFSTNVADTRRFGKAPMNQFASVPAFPDDKFKAVVRPNADTLYSILWFDVSKEPMIVRVPDSGGRYYLMPTLDMWTDVFDSAGKRTTGTGEQLLAIAAPGWQGKLPANVTLIHSPTAIGWMIGRTQTNGKPDYNAVHQFQAGFKATPLSQWGKAYQPPAGNINPAWDISTPPVVQVEKLDPAAYFALFTELTKLNPPHANDYAILNRMRRIGIEPGKPFAFGSASPEVQQALTEGSAAAQKEIQVRFKEIGVATHGWRTNLTTIGTYGTDYLGRAAVAFAGLGANTVEDAVYPTAVTDADGQPFNSDKAYVLHFDKDQIPPARAFWSLTMYNEEQFFAANSQNRYAIGDRDPLKYNPDGSLDIYIQRQSPGADKESNWLPAPANGAFTMNLRLYWPKREVLLGQWSPPAVKRLD
ncbi:DUF1254 domain-containing protein [Paraburkholderia sediminicola]|uniref:DUF1254 domain-containing protein n=1 Tax=Paraburkholderia sediminicola TaxID=458836 RepID=UPI0038B7923B